MFVILLTAYNVLDRPRRPQERFTVEMRRDGALWFLVSLLSGRTTGSHHSHIYIVYQILFGWYRSFTIAQY